MTSPHEHLARTRAQELIRDAEHARLARCLQPGPPWRRRPRGCRP
jgi:hypothetical protein